ncbi:hypothetical protein EMIHUDRAFT_215646 [Emiliania huxleyi CCMP1516]|uniref:Matrin-type domain-containing protein n=2 Tax=Emiliania huxleyi TaxID=2903 RepID=A0A0D3IGQ7_EMIH1|nr:hypothetical protein EMIHUDRAFT_215646 [Emiliania huxleyi CCMP1516]EOD10442.1 hypothetical protein EMIHUDRAFT_215646 [Emiliania huxleyi CCMP1516]|eukprot:XP_005762871.1 hypothetical protein EMIHUDRAFT_215646 [Emiliania huxleyi CCMP1516]
MYLSVSGAGPRYPEMPRYYCEYCDIALTHSSVPGRKQHHSGRKHIMNVIEYWANFQPALPTAPPPGAQRPPPPMMGMRPMPPGMMPMPPRDSILWVAWGS